MLRYRLKVWALFLLLVTGITGAVYGEPYLAVRTGLKCSVCHVNQTGQGKRTTFGSKYSAKDLPMTVLPDSTMDLILSSFMDDRFAVGLDFRLQNVSSQPVPNADPPSHLYANSFWVPEANLYIELSPLPDRLSFYLDELVLSQFGRPPNSREVFAMVKGGPWKSYVKVGQMFLPYGLRISDPDAFIMTKTGMLDSDFGVGIGMEPGAFSVSAAVHNAEPLVAVKQNTAKQLTASFSYVSRHGRIGGTINQNPKAAQVLAGGFFGLSVGPVALLGEFNRLSLKEYLGNPPTLNQYTGYGEVDIRVRRGLHFRGIVEYFNPGFAGVTQRRYKGEIAFMPVPFLQMRTIYSRNSPTRLPGGVVGIGNGDQLALELHIFL